MSPHSSGARTRPRSGSIARATRLRLAATACITLASGAALGAGFDTPILYTARHQGMGGAAIGYVDDPAAAFHNPAGLQGVQGLALLGDVSLLLAQLDGSPAPAATATSIQSDLIVAPLFLVAGAYRVHRMLSLGVALFPVASGGATYEYAVPGSEVNQHDSTSIVFYELTPVLSVNFPGNLSFGVGYRMSFLSFDRKLGERDDPRGLNLELTGADFLGLRTGVQYRPSKGFSIGAVYRSKITLTSRADEGIALTQNATDVQLPFTLPAQVGAGLRSDYLRFGAAFDASYSFQSQNERSELSGVINGTRVRVPNVFEWRNAFTLRFGFEYRLGPSQEVPIRVGYVYDDQVASRAYPSAFSSPPSPTRTLTTGGGYVGEDWELNLALALRAGGTRVQPTELAPPGTCPTCGYAGEYMLSMVGLYVDFSTDLDL